MTGFIKEGIPRQTPIIKNDFRHALCVGETGCGKTTSFMLPNIDDRIKNNYGLLIVDVKGNLHSEIKVLADKHERLQDVKEIGVPWGEKINIFKGVSRSLFLDTLNTRYGDIKDLWISATLGIAGYIYDLLTIANTLKTLLREKNSILFRYQLDANSLNEIVSSFSSFGIFIQKSKILHQKTTLKKLLNLSIEKGIKDSEIFLIKQFSDEFEILIEKIDEFYKEIDCENPASGNGGVFFTLQSLLSTFFQDGLDGTTDVKNLLENGKIVIIRANSYDEKLNLSIMNILYKRLLIRDNKRPISLFIDEFQRSVTKNNIVYVDLFREMKVELVAAIQNIHQLKNKLGESGCDEFIGNILHNYEYADHTQNSLKLFEYVYNGKKYLAEPIFLTNKHKILAQIKWQNYSKYKLPVGWIYLRQVGYKKVLTLNVKTKETKYHYLLDNKDMFLESELARIKNNKGRLAA